MPSPNPYSKYLNVRFSTVTKGNLVLLMYDGAINFLEEAKSRMIERDYSGKGIYLDRAFGVINELRTSLNFEVSQKLADSLNQLYFYMTKLLSKATLDNDVKAVETVLELLKGLRESWQQAAKETSTPTNKTHTKA